MRLTCFLCLLLASLAFAQTTPPTQQPLKPAITPQSTQDVPPIPPASKLPPDAAVITIKGLCEQKSAASSKDCQTVITRAQFERMADALQPNMPAAVKQRLANAYPQMLLSAHEAEKRSLDKGPHFEELMQFVRLQVLDQALKRDVQEKSAQVPDKDIETYYHDNEAAFEQFTFLRILVPRRKMADVNKPANKAADAQDDKDTKAEEQAAEEAMKKEADALRTRAAAGEDFDKLEKEAYESAGLKGSPPTTSIGKMRRVNMPPAHSAIFDLKPGEVSQVISDGTGYYIYKLTAKEILPLDQAKTEIHNTLQSQRYKDAMQAMQQSVTTELNQDYFSETAAPAAAPGTMKPTTGAGGRQPGKTPPPTSK